MATITNLKGAELYTKFHDGRSHRIRLSMWYWQEGKGEVPYAADGATSITFRLVQNITDAALLLDDAMTVQTGADDKADDGTTNVVQVDTTALTAGSPGDALWYVNVVDGGSTFIWGDTMFKCKTFADGPNS